MDELDTAAAFAGIEQRFLFRAFPPTYPASIRLLGPFLSAL